MYLPKGIASVTVIKNVNITPNSSVFINERLKVQGVPFALFPLPYAVVLKFFRFYQYINEINKYRN
jgi:hypothetical protein